MTSILQIGNILQSRNFLLQPKQINAAIDAENFINQVENIRAIEERGQKYQEQIRLNKGLPKFTRAASNNSSDLQNPLLRALRLLTEDPEKLAREATNLSKNTRRQIANLKNNAQPFNNDFQKSLQNLIERTSAEENLRFFQSLKRKLQDLELNKKSNFSALA